MVDLEYGQRLELIDACFSFMEELKRQGGLEENKRVYKSVQTQNEALIKTSYKEYDLNRFRDDSRIHTTTFENQNFRDAIVNNVPLLENYLQIFEELLV